MFKLKPGNVFQKVNSMNRKQAYTWGAVAVVFVVALMMLASFMGEAEDASFNGMDARGYDLAQMPFLNDEAEQYLLSSKYPDMQGNNSTLLYSSQQKEERQAQDALEASEEDTASTASSSSYSSANEETSSSRSTRGYSGRSYSGGGTATPTQVGQLGQASLGHASGSGVGGSWGAPRGDFSTYKSQDKGKEQPVTYKEPEARKALYQFARASRAAAGFKEGKGGNAKRALMGGDVKGSDAFGEDGIDLSNAEGLAIDTEAPALPDLSNVEEALNDTKQKAQEKQKEKEKEELDFWTKLWQQFLMGMVDVAVKWVGNVGNSWVDSWDWGKTDSKS